MSKPKQIVIMNKFGAVHSVSEELYRSVYRNDPDVRLMRPAELKKYGELSNKVAEAHKARLGAVDEDGNPDGPARAKAAKAYAQAVEKLDAYVKELTDELS